MLTYSPTPRLKDLGLLIKPSPSDQELTAPWKKSGDQSVWFSKSAWALAAICQAWSEAHQGKVPTLWIPAYFCNQSLWPARHTGANIQFYPIARDLAPQWEKLPEMASSQKPDLFLLTHFFGHENTPQPARQFCDQMNCLLIEDGAHVLRPFHQIGELADFTFYSLHKLLSIPDGSLLIIRPRANRYRELILNAKLKLGDHSASPWNWLAKRWVQKFLPSSVTRKREKANPVRFDENPIAHEMAKLLSPSALSQKLLAHQIKELSQIANTRRENETEYRKAFQSISDLHPWPQHGHPDRTPYYAVFYCDDALKAQKLFNEFRQQGLIVQTWPDLAPEVLNSKKQFSEAIHARSTFLTFPVHQSLRQKDIQQYRPG